MQIYLKEFGPSAVAAYGVALRVEQLFAAVFGLTGALLPIITKLRCGEAKRVTPILVHMLEIWLDLYAVACQFIFHPLLMRISPQTQPSLTLASAIYALLALFCQSI